MTHIQKLPLTEVLPHIGTVKVYQIQNIPYRFSLCNARFQLFQRSLECACCGLHGEYFMVETEGHGVDPTRAHLNLYGLNVFGHPVMLTLDHIVPKSQGGHRNPENVQLLCANCNQRKKDQSYTLAELRGRVRLSHKTHLPKPQSWVAKRHKFGRVITRADTVVLVQLYCTCMAHEPRWIAVTRQLKYLFPAEARELSLDHKQCLQRADFGNSSHF